jgi:azurin
VTVAGAPLAGNVTASARAADLMLPVPKGTFHTGANTITVQVTNQRAEGGFVGTNQDMYLAAGQTRTSLAGPWKYRVERSSNNGALYSKPGELAAHVAFTAGGGLTGAAAATLPSVAAVPDVVLRLSVVPNEMKYATTELTVQPGQVVEIVYTNPDTAEHNFVVSAPGSLQAVGAAADALSQTPNAKAMDYVPDIAAIIFKTKMLAPGQTTTFQFTAPTTAGDYPYICTYPNHWRIMNGVLHVVVPAGRGGGAGRGGAPAPATPAPGIGRGGQR